MSREGLPLSGVRRVRDAETAARQWRIGGGDGSIKETRTMDLLHPEPGTHETMLPVFTSISTGSVDGLAGGAAEVTPRGSE